MHIRVARSDDRKDIQSVHESAFPAEEWERVAKLAVDLLAEDETTRVLSLIAEIEEVVVGHVAFSPVTMDTSENLRGYILAPLGVKSDYQKRRVGSQLIESGIQRLLERGVHLLLVYGDPGYYDRFGFSVETAERYIPPYKLQYPFGWQGMTLNEHSVGESSVKIDCVQSLRDPVLW